MASEKLPRLVYNPLSVIGGSLALVCGLVMLALLVVGALFEPASNPYFGIFIYVVLPLVLIMGLLLVPLGMWRERRRRRRSRHMPNGTSSRPMMSTNGRTT
jgi:hypothetical protein